MTLIRRLQSSAPEFERALHELLAYEAEQDASIEAVCRDILHRIRHEGDAALLEYTERFDGLAAPQAQALELSADELQQALEGLPADQRAALEAAASRIRAYHEHQIQQDWSFTEANGTELGQRDRKSTRLNSSHVAISYAVFCLKKKRTALFRSLC